MARQRPRPSERASQSRTSGPSRGASAKRPRAAGATGRPQRPNASRENPRRRNEPHDAPASGGGGVPVGVWIGGGVLLAVVLAFFLLRGNRGDGGAADGTRETQEDRKQREGRERLEQAKQANTVSGFIQCAFREYLDGDRGVADEADDLAFARIQAAGTHEAWTAYLNNAHPKGRHHAEVKAWFEAWKAAAQPYVKLAKGFGTRKNPNLDEEEPPPPPLEDFSVGGKLAVFDADGLLATQDSVPAAVRATTPDDVTLAVVRTISRRNVGVYVGIGRAKAYHVTATLWVIDAKTNELRGTATFEADPPDEKTVNLLDRDGGGYGQDVLGDTSPQEAAWLARFKP